MKLDHVLEKLKTLDPKTFGMLNNMIGAAECGHSFLQVKKPDMEEQMMKLQPVLEKLRSLDPKTKMMKLDHVLEKLKTLDPKTFGMLNNMIGAAEGGHSFLQVQKPDMEEQMMKLQPVLEKL